MKNTLMAFMAAAGMLSGVVLAQDEGSSSWLPTLVTESPESGFDLAITLSRTGVRLTQPDTDVLHSLRTTYAHDPDSLTAASQVIAIHFQTIAAANNYWRDAD